MSAVHVPDDAYDAASEYLYAHGMEYPLPFECNDVGWSIQIADPVLRAGLLGVCARVTP